MIRWTNKVFAIAIALVCGSATVRPAFAQSDTASTKYFSAKVMNIRRAATGKTLVTVLFTSKMTESGYIILYSGTEECRKSATLIDGDGNEYGTIRCMSPPKRYGTDSSRVGMYIEGDSSSSFVYEFSTPISTDQNAKSNINVLIPLFYNTCETSGFPYPVQRCIDSTTSLSFYGLTVR